MKISTRTAELKVNQSQNTGTIRHYLFGTAAAFALGVAGLAPMQSNAQVAFTVPVNNVATGAAEAADGTSPGTGSNGLNGYSGGYSCQQLTMGLACGAFYAFGTFNTHHATNGSDAPSGNTTSQMVNNNPTVISAAVNGSPDEGQYEIEVVQLATGQKQSTRNTTNVVLGSTLNGGFAFDVVITPDDVGNPAITLEMDPGSTLQQVITKINTDPDVIAAGYTATTTRSGSTDVITITGPVGSGNDFVISTIAYDVDGLPVAPPNDKVVVLEFAPPPAIEYVNPIKENPTDPDEIIEETPLGAVSQGAIINITNLTTNVTTNHVSDDNNFNEIGLDIGLQGIGTSVILVQEVGSVVDNGNNGTGNASNATHAYNFVASDIDLAGTAINVDVTGGAGGAAQIGGNGGTGGNGGNAQVGTVPSLNVIIFPPIILPNTKVYGSNSGFGGRGADGGQGGIGGFGATGDVVSLVLAADSAEVGAVASLISTGGIGGAGGQGGNGGNGGNGGHGSAEVESNDMTIVSATAPSSIGGAAGTGGEAGKGGAGGTGGVVSINSTITETTANNGYIVTSQGGEGGQGGQGGTGGRGGNGGNGAAVVSGLGAQSTDGAGGALGGTGFMGGVGGDGGHGNTATVILGEGELNASGTGITARSIGGDGGVGGTGGTGGVGGEGGTGRGATNLVALGLAHTSSSIGGTGGVGGDGGTGGVGGIGGNGGNVFVTTNGIDGRITAGINAILAESLGGTGGTGGIGGNGGQGGKGGNRGNAVSHFPESTSLSPSRTGATGGDGGDAGNGGDGGHGGNITINNAQQLVTTGLTYSSAILAQSLGGMGGLRSVTTGTGGAGGAGSDAGSDQYCTFDDGCTGQSWGAGAVGGLGNDGANEGDDSYVGGAGGIVSIVNTGNIWTVGNRSNAITAVSVGGVAGLAGFNAQDIFWDGLNADAHSGASDDVTADNSAVFVTDGDNSSGISALSYSVGEASGTAQATNTGSITTTGNNAPAIIAESRVHDFAGAAAADSGNVTVTNTGAMIETTGTDSGGIIANSISALGNSGKITVTNNSNGRIILSGDGNSSAISINSEAMGTTGNSGDIDLFNMGGRIFSYTGGSTSVISAVTQSANGNSGSILFDNTGGEVLSDNAGVAIYLASIAGGGTSGNITARNHSSMICTADNCTALEMNTGGNMLLENSDIIRAGTGGTAVSIVGGNNNSIINGFAGAADAIIETTGGIWDTVILGTTGNDSIQNISGATIIGNIDLGSGNNTFFNGLDSLYMVSNTLDLGGGLFTNEGIFSIGGDMNIMSANNTNGFTTINGDFTQGATGHTLINIGFQTGAALNDYTDFIQVTGSADLDGFITLEPSTGAGKPGSFHIALLNATGGITYSGISIFNDLISGTSSSTPIFQAVLEVLPDAGLGGDTLYLNYDIDYNPAGLTPNASTYANVVNQIQTDGVPAFQPIADELLRITNMVDLQKAYDSLTGEGTIASQQAVLEGRGQFSSAVLSGVNGMMFCNEEKRKDLSDCQKDNRSWFEISYVEGKQGGNADVAGTSLEIRSARAGFEHRQGERSVLGLAFDINHTSFAAPGRWTMGHSKGLTSALYGSTWTDSGLFAKGIFSAGAYDNKTDRYALGRPVEGDFTSYAFGTGVEFGYRHNLGMFNLMPFTALQADELVQSGWNEENPLYGNHYASESVSSRTASAGLAFDTEVMEVKSGKLTASGRAAYVHEFNTERSATAYSLAAPGYWWRANGLEAPQESAQMDLGLNLSMSNNVDISLKGIYRPYPEGAIGGGRLSVSYKF